MLIGEFETYRAESEACVEARQKEWRHTVHALTFLLAQQFQLDPRSSRLSDVTLDLSAAVTSEQVEALRAKLQNLFQRMEETATTRQQEEIEEQDRSLANDNAAGLRGGGAAIEHLRSMIAANRPGYVGLFRLSCLDVVGERFGVEGTQDCLMAVSAFLTGNLRHEDSVYHWSETSLLAICDRKVREDMIHAELNRILARNRDFTIKIGDRTIMLRIPIELQLFPLAHFTSADDLQSFPFTRVATGRSLSEQANAR
jgi:GGDEF domain-containing protein